MPMPDAVLSRGRGAASWPSWIAALVLCLLLGVLACGGDEWRLALRYERLALAGGQWWRWITAHFVHLGWAHAALNMAGVVLCSLLSPALFSQPRRLAMLLAIEVVGISAGLWFWSPEVGNYVGFSGVLYGLFVVGLWPQRRDPCMAAALLVIVVWMAWQWFGQPLASEEDMIGGRIVSIAHVYGAAMGALWLACEAIRSHFAHHDFSDGS